MIDAFEQLVEDALESCSERELREVIDHIRDMTVETCRMETDDGLPNWNSCSECDSDYYTDQPIHYCPNCGRKVVE